MKASKTQSILVLVMQFMEFIESRQMQQFMKEKEEKVLQK